MCVRAGARACVCTVSIDLLVCPSVDLSLRVPVPVWVDLTVPTSGVSVVVLSLVICAMRWGVSVLSAWHVCVCEQECCSDYRDCRF